MSARTVLALGALLALAHPAMATPGMDDSGAVAHVPGFKMPDAAPTTDAPVKPRLCQIADEQPTTSEKNLMGAIARVFMARYLGAGGGFIDVQARCADLAIRLSDSRYGYRGTAHFRLYNPIGESDGVYELDDEQGVLIGRIDFERLSDRYFIPYTSAYVKFYGLPGAVCDGPSAPHPGTCTEYYSTVYGGSVQLVMQAFQYVHANIRAADLGASSW